MPIPFDENRNVRDLARFINSIDTDSAPQTLQRILSPLQKAIEGIANLESVYANSCKITWDEQVQRINANAERILSEKNIGDVSSFYRVNDAVYRIIYERVLRSKDWYIEHEGPILRLMIKSRDFMSDEDFLKLDLWKHEINQNIINEYIGKQVAEITSMHDNAKNFSNQKIDEIMSYYNTIKGFEEKLNHYKENVKAISAEYNFVRLAGAFRDLIKEKRMDLLSNKKLLILMSILVLAPLMGSIIFTYWIWQNSTDTINALKEKLLYSAPVLIPLEAILIYYFRIILKEQLSLKAQILQLELRYSVCAFIEGYAEFTKEIPREKLEKFEALVFSGITPDPTAVPGTFDGMDQLINLAKAAGGK